MCGIGALLNMGNTDPEDVKRCAANLLVALSQRGKNAAGIAAVMNDGSVAVCKKGVCADDFIRSAEYKEFMDAHWDARMFLVHARAATKGKPEKNKNNHPFESSKYVLVHNGIVKDDVEQFFERIGVDWEKHGIDKDVETDSYLILKIAEVYGPTATSDIDGSATILLYEKDAKRLYLFMHEKRSEETTSNLAGFYRSTYQQTYHPYPLHAGWCEQKKLLVIASTKEAIEQTVEEKRMLFNIITAEQKSTPVTTSMVEPNVLYCADVFSEDVQFRKVQQMTFHAARMESQLRPFYKSKVFLTTDGKCYVKFAQSVSQKIENELAELGFAESADFYEMETKQFPRFLEVFARNKEQKKSGKTAATAEPEVATFEGDQRPGYMDSDWAFELGEAGWKKIGKRMVW